MVGCHVENCCVDLSILDQYVGPIQRVIIKDEIFTRTPLPESALRALEDWRGEEPCRLGPCQTCGSWSSYREDNVFKCRSFVHCVMYA